MKTDSRQREGEREREGEATKLACASLDECKSNLTFSSFFSFGPLPRLFSFSAPLVG